MFDTVGKTEPVNIRSIAKNAKIEYRISNNNTEDYQCYYCDYVTNDENQYERHIVLKHPGRPAYPNKDM
jgi:hypothetical protein